jgi:hypothetical protein
MLSEQVDQLGTEQCWKHHNALSAPESHGTLQRAGLLKMHAQVLQLPHFVLLVILPCQSERAFAGYKCLRIASGQSLRIAAESRCLAKSLFGNATLHWRRNSC